MLNDNVVTKPIHCPSVIFWMICALKRINIKYSSLAQSIRVVRMSGKKIMPVGDDSRATLSDVAKLSGFSIKTVSRVFASDDKVASETKTKILEAARRLNFRPNLMARNLRTGENSKTVGLVIGDLSNPFYFKVASAIEKTLAQAGLTLVLSTSDEDEQSEVKVVEALLSQQVRGLIIVPVASSQSYLTPALAVGTPFVFLDRPPKFVPADSISLDNRKGAREATEALISAGHKKIGFIASHGQLPTIQDRIAGFRDALLESDAQYSASWVRITEYDDAKLDHEIKELLESDDGPTAFVSGNNRSSMAFLKAYLTSTRELGFVGFDDFELAEALELSVVDYDLEDMGRQAAKLLLQRIENPHKQVEELTMETRLVKRGSLSFITGFGRSGNDNLPSYL